MLIGWRAANDHVLYSWAKYSWADDKGTWARAEKRLRVQARWQVAKNEMWRVTCALLV